MADQVEHDEVGEDPALEHALQVELEVRLADHRAAVPQEQPPAPVGHDPPQVLSSRAVEQLLHQRVRRLLSGSGDTSGAPLQVNVGADQMDGDRAVPVADRIPGPAHGDPAVDGVLLQGPVPEVVEQELQPAVTGEPDRGVVV